MLRTGEALKELAAGWVREFMVWKLDSAELYHYGSLFIAAYAAGYRQGGIDERG